MTPWTVTLGTATDGSDVTRDLSAAPHVLLAGCTGSGKSVGMHALIAGLVQAGTPQDTQIIIADVKMVEFRIWERAPHVRKVLTDRDAIAAELHAMCKEMERRYAAMMRRGVADISELSGTSHAMPRIFFFCDEIADLVMRSRIKSENIRASLVLGALTRIAQLGRAAGIHLIIATQRPAADTLPGNLRANMPTRWGFRVRTKAESRIILDSAGCEALDSAPGTSLLSWRGAQGTFCQGLYIDRTAIKALVLTLTPNRRAGPVVRLPAWSMDVLVKWVGAAATAGIGAVVLWGMATGR